jgi:hypothetical protein
MKRAYLVLTLTVAMAVASSAQTPYSDRFITVNGLRIHYLDWGNDGKQPFPHAARNRKSCPFDHIALRFKDNYHVLAIDMRGHYVKDIRRTITRSSCGLRTKPQDSRFRGSPREA